MALSTTVRDCLYVHWAVPVVDLPLLPETLRYQTVDGIDGEVGFVSLLLFRHQGLRLDHLSWARLGFPQANFRLNVLDRDAVPSVLFWRMWAPWWAVAASRMVARRPMTSARLVFPPSPIDLGSRSWSWRAQAEGRLVLAAQLGASAETCGAKIGDWTQTVHFFRHRTRGYLIESEGRLRRIETEQPEGDVQPMKVEVDDDSLLTGALDCDRAIWRTPHCSWLSSQMDLSFELVEVEKKRLAGGVPAPG